MLRDGVYLWGTKSHVRQRPMPVNETTLASRFFDQLQQAMACDPAGFTELYRDYLADAWQTLRMLREAVQQQQSRRSQSESAPPEGQQHGSGRACVVAQCARRLRKWAAAPTLRVPAPCWSRLVQALRKVQAELSDRLGPGVVPADRQQHSRNYCSIERNGDSDSNSSLDC